MRDSVDGWPALPYQEWRPTRDTLHMYTQVMGKLRLALSPFEPEWAHVPLYVSARGLTTSVIPVGLRAFEAELDLIDHALLLRDSEGQVEPRPLGGSVAEFYEDVMAALRRMRVEVTLSVVPYSAFYAYGYPAPENIERVSIQPRGAGWNSTAGEFLLPYDAARAEADPRRAILDFLNSTYTGAATLMGWDAELTRVVAPTSART